VKKRSGVRREHGSVTAPLWSRAHASHEPEARAPSTGRRRPSELVELAEFVVTLESPAETANERQLGHSVAHVGAARTDGVLD